jgi:hypothetical protein
MPRAGRNGLPRTLWSGPGISISLGSTRDDDSTEKSARFAVAPTRLTDRPLITIRAGQPCECPRVESLGERLDLRIECHPFP